MANNQQPSLDAAIAREAWRRKLVAAGFAVLEDAPPADARDHDWAQHRGRKWATS